jgi:cell envelope opacity-associated protein A
VPTLEEVTEYNLEEIGGPDPNNLRMDMKGKISSPWNKAVSDILVDLIRGRMKEGTAWEELPERSDAYILEIVTAQLERGRTVWRGAQPKVKEDGTVEAPSEVEERMQYHKEENEKLARASTRRRKVSPHFIQIIQ